MIGEGKDESRIPQDQISGVYLSLPGEAKGRALAVVYQDGSRLSGALDRVDKNSLRLIVPGIKEHLTLPLDGLRSLVGLEPQPTSRRMAACPESSSSMRSICQAGWSTDESSPARAALSGSRRAAVGKPAASRESRDASSTGRHLLPPSPHPGPGTPGRP